MTALASPPVPSVDAGSRRDDVTALDALTKPGGVTTAFGRCDHTTACWLALLSELSAIAVR